MLVIQSVMLYIDENLTNELNLVTLLGIFIGYLKITLDCQLCDISVKSV